MPTLRVRISALSSLTLTWEQHLDLLRTIHGFAQLASSAQTAQLAESIDTLDYSALAREASEFPLEKTNEERINWINEKLGLTMTLTGELNCPTLMAPIDDTGARDRFHNFAEQYMLLVWQKNPQLRLPPYNKRAHTPKVSQEAHVTHEKLDGYFSTTFFNVTTGEEEFQKIVKEYKTIPMNERDNCRERALWILRKTGQSIFYKPDGTLDSAENGIPDADSSPDWDKQTGIRDGNGGFVSSDWLYLSGVRVGHGVWGAWFSHGGAGDDLFDAGYARVPVLANTRTV